MAEYLTLPRGSMPHSYMDGRVRKILRVGDPIAADHPEAVKLSARLVPCFHQPPPAAAEVAAPAIEEPAPPDEPSGSEEIVLETREEVVGGSIYRTVAPPRVFSGRDEPEDDEE